ncbi:molybdopterin-dependent oxidoreductase [Mycobacterium sp. CBMA247]|nr:MULTISPECIES: molybdopterin-dependent oxidoreductase [unclassified Mycolicibacterium]MUL84995.1 molybdopterin-dependent oxidoreductase [Mycolicibacterium sp. CBMA 329]MUL90962.1 molybdopterin-dependent oxidoreductase [Mycolicibacterium sp. CBMA 331]MUL98367.1 molybdopterin-dependent oxidoreductase [Mycolicibacterium sp. CBMA 334]MUM40721.1 molybdopterin-dependent oxidoreductase [Mycolicibacterium sp. CBMA 247]MUM46917.1 molybdopterin-dependent oxidoreductase [Mycolicibacterium sp. CBMA 294]
MIFTQHYLACLSHASYLIGDETTGRAIVVDPRRDVDVYLDEAAANGLDIERVIETHVHADFLSGHLELAAATGAVISYGEGADVEFPVEPLRDGQRLSLGEVTVEVLATPGHTPESICVAVYEHPDDTVPYGVLTGDTLFVGDVGRPDLLASSGLSADTLARELYRSLHDKLLRLPDAARVFPAHGAGSACGKQLSSETSSTIGEQRQTNYALQSMDEDQFVAAVTEGQSARPHYFEFDAHRNRELRPLLDEEAPRLLDIEDVCARRDAGAILLDSREPVDYASGHLRDAVNVGLQGRFAEWAGDVLSPDRDIVLVGDPVIALESKVRLARVGYDRVVGQLRDLAAVFAHRPDLVETTSRLTIEQLAELRGLEPHLQVVDVRSPGETAAGTIPKAREIPLAVFTDSVAALDRTAPVVLYCGSGYRSVVAASVLRAAGFEDVSDVIGGYGAWQSAGLPSSRGDEADIIGDAPHVGARAAKKMVDAGALLLDVREPDEWYADHAPRAMLVPMGRVRARQDELPHDQPIVVVCRSGGRSAAVTASLRQSGFDAVNLAGGMCAWASAGLPVVTGGSDPGLIVHREEPLNCETSLSALVGGVVMPNARFYVRNHFATPTLDPESFELTVTGFVERPLRLSLRDLHNMPSQSLVATLECAGNGRSMFDPPSPGEQWRFGAASTAEWTGVPLVEILDRAGLTPDACEVVFRGADAGLVDNATAPVRFERSLSVDDARDSDALVAYAMNGDSLPVQHGRPVRLVVPGWYAVASVKWLTEIAVIGEPLQAFFQTDRYVYEYEDPGHTVREPVRLQQVRALITEPSDGASVTAGELVVRGVAWSGAAAIEHVDVSVGGGPWQPARLIGERHRHSWQWWELLTRCDSRGTNTLRSRATDLAGRIQPERPAWNRLGYGGNGIQTVSVMVE